MKEYLRMSDYFAGHVAVKFAGITTSIEYDAVSGDILMSDVHAALSHAINSHDELVARVNELESFLHHFVDNSYNVDAGGADFTATTCEALEMAEKLDNRAYDGMWHGH